MAVPYKKLGLGKSAKPEQLIQRMNDIKEGRMDSYPNKSKKTKMKSSSMKCKTCGKMSCAGCKSKKTKMKADSKDTVEKKTKMKKLPKLGSGKRFANLKASLGHKGAKNPAALAAYIGRKKYGAKKFGKLSAKGKK